jgi:hypothetical protein
MFSDEGTARLLAEVVEHLESGKVEQARLTLLEKLDFDRMLRPVHDPSRTREFIDPAAAFGVDRVHQTGDQIRQCLRAIGANDLGPALKFAKAAAARWSRKEAG